MPMRYRVLAATAVMAVVLAAVPRAKEPACEFTGVTRVVAVGDVHGAYDALLSILRTAGLIDDRQRWVGGKTQLVQVGDMLDRGADSRKVLDFYRKLEKDAASAGGRVHVLLGNHEVMRMTSDFRYVTPAEYAAFANSSSAALRASFVEGAPDPDVKAHFASMPLGGIEMLRAFGSKEPYGAYLRTLNAVVRINGVLFVHGGISPSVASMTCGAINQQIRKELTTDLATTLATPEKTLSRREDGPLWYRGLAMAPETEAYGLQVDAMLAAQKATAIVMAHTPQVDGRILVRHDGRVFVIDTGMQATYVATGRPSALEFANGAFTAIYLDGRQPPQPPPSPPITNAGAPAAASVP